ncbi:MAG: DUF1566 domain-containing protein [Candidatus Thiodiazotropha sp. (ex Lucinoma borealis)]|nr:DUF1566 domain-containing protein [Candidatus Thiodiazotropha sp. (ex Lucinoma borealis)]
MKNVSVCILRQPYLFLLAILLTATPTWAQTCNSAIIRTAPDSRYLDHGDSTVTDLQTGLMWQRCSLGQSGAGCTTGTATRFAWYLALQQGESINTSGGFAGYSDWRLPNKAELESLVEEGCHSPAINNTNFPNTSNTTFWSSSPDSRHTNSALGVHFRDGYSSYYRRSSGYQVRFVRGGL